MSEYSIVTVDRRYNGFGYFKYVIKPEYRRGDLIWLYASSRLMFQEWREWCRANFGEGMERDWACGLMHSGKIPSQHWAWDTEHGNKRLYLKGDEELAFFKLKF